MLGRISFRMKDGISLELQVEEFESLVRKLESVKEAPLQKTIISKLLCSLPPKFSAFRTAWKSTAEEVKTKDKLISRLIKEDKRLSRDNEPAMKKDAVQKPAKKDGKKKKLSKNKSPTLRNVLKVTLRGTGQRNAQKKDADGEKV